MSHSLQPLTGQWYRHLDKGQSFRVVSVEKDRDLIELQHFDGDLEEVEFAAWFAMDLEATAEPEDWTGPMDDSDTDDLGYSDTAMKEQDWRESVDASPPPPETWEDQTPEDERDEWDEGRPAEESSDSAA